MQPSSFQAPHSRPVGALHVSSGTSYSPHIPVATPAVVALRQRSGRSPPWIRAASATGVPLGAVAPVGLLHVSSHDMPAGMSCSTAEYWR
jgi:hypothetical protein